MAWAKGARYAASQGARSLWKRTLDVVLGLVILWVILFLLDRTLSSRIVRRRWEDMRDFMRVERPCSQCGRGFALVFHYAQDKEYRICPHEDANLRWRRKSTEVT